MRNKYKTKNTFPCSAHPPRLAFTPSFLTLLPPPNPSCTAGWEGGLRSVHKRFISAASSSSCLSPTIGWDLSTGCSSFRINLLQQGLSPGCNSLREFPRLWCGLSVGCEGISASAPGAHLPPPSSALTWVFILVFLTTFFPHSGIFVLSSIRFPRGTTGSSDGLGCALWWWWHCCRSSWNRLSLAWDSLNLSSQQHLLPGPGDRLPKQKHRNDFSGLAHKV